MAGSDRDRRSPLGTRQHRARRPRRDASTATPPSADPREIEPVQEVEGGSAGAPPSDAKPTTFFSWSELERVADEAADIDSIVRKELDAVGSSHLIQEPPAARRRTPTRPAPRRLGRTLVFVVVASLAVAAGLAVVPHLLGGGTATQPPPSPTPSATPARPTSKPSPTAAAVNSPTSIHARLTFTAPCWVQAVADGQTVFTGTITGSARAFHAHRSLQLTLGNAGGVDLVANGRSIPTGTPGQVVHLTLTLEHGRLVETSS